MLNGVWPRKTRPMTDHAKPYPVGENVAPETRKTLMDLLGFLHTADDLLDSLRAPLAHSAAQHATGYYLHDERFHASVEQFNSQRAKLREVRDYIWRAYLAGAPDKQEDT